MPHDAPPRARPSDPSRLAVPASAAVSNDLPRPTEQLLHSVFTAMSEGLIIQERRGAIVHANPAAERILGLSADEMAGRTSVDPRWRAEHEDGSPFPGETHPAMVALATGRPVHGVVMVVHKPDGARRLIEINAEPVWAPGEPTPGHVVATFLDITDRRAADDALRATADRLSDLYNNAPCGYHSLGPDGTILEINDTELEWLGVAREEVVGRKTPADFLTGPSLETFARTFPSLRDGLPRLEVEIDYPTPDGSVRHTSVTATPVLDDNGRFVMTRSVVHDITELVKLRRELERRARDQEAMLDNDVIAVARLRDRRLVWANAAAARLMGYDQAEMVGLSTRAFLPNDEAFQRIGGEFYGEVRARGAYRGQVELLRKDGTPVFLELYGSPLGDSGDYLAFISDLTSIRRAHARLLEAQKMESVGRLAGGVAHEFNNKLQTILGVTELAMLDAPAGTGLSRDLGSIQDAARHASSITKQLMAYAGKQPAWPQRLELTRAVASTLERLAPSIPANLRLTQQFDATPWPVAMDPAQFAEVLANLVVNAREALESRTGQIAVEVRNVTLDEAQASEHLDARAGAYVALIVRDNGPGMPAEVARRAFEPFFTTRPFGSNNGLGLSTVYGVATQNGGWVRLVTEPEVGTEVTVYLPRAATPAEVDGSAPGRPRSLTVLVVEDDRAVAETAGAMLRRLGHTALSVSNADDALARVRTSSFDVLLTDVILPGTNGCDLAEMLKREHPDLHVVLMSAYSEAALTERCPAVAEAEVLAKPFTIEELRRRLSSPLHHESGRQQE